MIEIINMLGTNLLYTNCNIFKVVLYIFEINTKIQLYYNGVKYN